MRWTVHGERAIYQSEWMDVVLTDVEVPEVAGRPSERFEHHVVRSAPVAGAVVVDVIDGVPSVLLLWRHRFITDSWGWEIPAGGIDGDEPSLDAALREVLEESGWEVGGEVGTIEHLIDYFPVNGLSDKRFDLYLARGARHVGDPADPSESERIEWLPLARLRDEIAADNIRDGFSLTALLWCLAFDLI